jgi:hypothetical protein
VWKDGRENWDTLTAVFDYGPQEDRSSGFQVTFQSRQHNGEENPAEIYYSNGGELNLMTNQVSPKGGLTQAMAQVMGMKENRLPVVDLSDRSVRAVATANTGADPLTSSHVRNWMECVRNRRQPNAPVEAGYAHSIANIMTTAASRTGYKATFDEQRQEVIVNGQVFTY